MASGEDRNQGGYHKAAHAARRLILEQHTELRRLLALGLVQTRMPSHGRQPAHAALKAVIGRIRVAFLQHLADEELVLPPLFGAELAKARFTQTLHDEHARQRQEIEALHALADEESAALAERFDGLARALLIDIAEEERKLARAVAILDGRAAAGCDAPQQPREPRPHGSRPQRVASTPPR